MGSIPVASPTPPRRLRFRRAPIFVGILLLGVGVAVALLLAFALPRDGPDGGIVIAGSVEDFPLGSVTYFEDDHSDSAQNLEGETVAWRDDFEFQGKLGWFRSPFHGETFSDRGILTFGPTSRDMDRFAVSIENGQVVVDTSTAICGPLMTLPDAPCKRVAPLPLLLHP